MPRPAIEIHAVEQTRQRLCDTALALYRNEGYDAVSFRRIAERLGTSHTQPYRYFESMEALFAAMRLRCFQAFAAVIRDHDKTGAHPADRLRAIHFGILAYVRAHSAEYRLMFAMRQPSLERYPELLAARRAAFDNLVEIVQIAVDRGLIVGDARTIMHIGWGAVHGVLSLHTADQLVHGRDLEELTEPLLVTVFHPLFDPHDTAAAPKARGVTA